jgi:dihydroorotate dehydrogenase
MQKLSEIKHDKPMYIKMPINQSWEEFNELLDLLDPYKNVNGVVIGNLNKNYADADFPEEAPKEYRGGLSGKLCRKLSTDLIRKTKNQWGKRFTIIGCGGVMSVADAQEKFEAGADLLQLISGMIFEGPHLMKEIGNSFDEGQ